MYTTTSSTPPSLHPSYNFCPRQPSPPIRKYSLSQNEVPSPYDARFRPLKNPNLLTIWDSNPGGGVCWESKVEHVHTTGKGDAFPAVGLRTRINRFLQSYLKSIGIGLVRRKNTGVE